MMLIKMCKDSSIRVYLALLIPPGSLAKYQKGGLGLASETRVTEPQEQFMRDKNIKVNT